MTGEFFSKQKEYYDKVEKSQKIKATEDKKKMDFLKEVHDKRSEGVNINLKDLRYRQKEMFQYYDSRLKERIDKVEQVK